MSNAAAQAGGGAAERNLEYGVWRRPEDNIPPSQPQQSPASSVGERSPVPVTAVWRQRAATRLHALGARPVLEALIEVADGKPLDSVLADFARLDPTIVRALGGDAFPSAVFAVAGR